MNGNGSTVQLVEPHDLAAVGRGLLVVHSGVGRLRVHLPHWTGKGAKQLTAALRRLPGVTSAQASAVTRNVLVLFKPGLTDSDALVATLRSFRLEPRGAADPAKFNQRSDVIEEAIGNRRRARIPLKGLHKDPGLAARVIRRLQSEPGVQAQVNPLTGRVLVDYDQKLIHIEEILAEVAHLEMPLVPEKDQPAHPLDPMPLVRSATRALGALVGLGFVTVQGLIAPLTQGSPTAAAIAGSFNLFQAFPGVRNGIQRVLGATGAEVATHGITIVALAAADIPLGLVMAGAEALLFLSVVTQRRAAWRRYEDCLDCSAVPAAGGVIRLEPGMRVPHNARVKEGIGTAQGRSGRILRLAPGLKAPAGARVAGGPFVMEMLPDDAVVLQPRTVPPRMDSNRRYLRWAAPLSFAYAGLIGLTTGSLTRAFEAMMLVNPYPSLVGAESANLATMSRLLRAGLTVVGSRGKRAIRCPDVLLLDGPRLLSDGKEVDLLMPLAPGLVAERLQTLAGSVVWATGAAMGKTLQIPDPLPAADPSFDGRTASAKINAVRYTLRVANEGERNQLPDAKERRGGMVLALDQEGIAGPIGLIGMRPRLLPGVSRLVDACRRQGVELAVLPGKDEVAARRITDLAGVKLLPDDDAVTAIRSRQQQGKLVTFVADGAHGAAGFAQCDLAIGMAAGHGTYFPAQADLLAPDVIALADFIDSGIKRDHAVRDGVLYSLACNAVGLALSLQGPIGYHAAFIPGYVAALLALGGSLLRLRGGNRPEAVMGYLNDPRPERWGHRAIPSVLRAFHTSENGLTNAAAARRVRPRPAAEGREALLAALGKQFRAPTMSLLAGGACLTLVLGQPLNTAIISTTLTINVLAGLWQERQLSKGGEAVQRLGAPRARVLREGEAVELPAADVVPGDVLLLMQGDRVAADARLISADALEIGQATLTGESLPVGKGPNEAGDHNRIVLEGSDVIVGTGRAVVVAVGRHTRLGATAAAMNAATERESPLGTRLSRVLRVALPVAITGGFITGAAELFHTGGALAQMITLGVTTALSTIPEGLPILSGVGQAAVSRRLARHNTLVRRLAGIEALGRVDVACIDKTGTLTEGRLSVCLIDDCRQEVAFPGPLDEPMRRILLSGALACPHPEDPRVLLPHPTDAALIRAAHDAGLTEPLRARRDGETPFDSMRRLSVARVDGRLCVKGAPERLIPRCVSLWGQPLDDGGRAELLERASLIAERGLRLLMVAEGPGDASLSDPVGLDAMGFVALTDSLRVSAPEAVTRCQQAGIRVLILTGDHLGTARTIGRQVGVFRPPFVDSINASELHDLTAAELDERLESVAVVSRATPVDKVRIIESLRRRGHTVAMTGDGVNDAPAVRLADVGVAMGQTGTEAARQAADVVLADDDFAHLAEALVEGRSFWRNMRHALGLLLGGNAGEMGLYVGVTVAGFGAPLSPTQILLVSLITDALPSLAIAMRPPQDRDLARLTKEGITAMDASLPRDTFRRGVATGLPSLGAYIWTRMTAGPAEAGAVTFASIICTQLAQTLDVGQAHGMLSRSTLLAVGGSLTALGLAVGVPPVGEFLGLLAPSAQGWGTVAASSAAAVALSRSIGVASKVELRQWLARLSDELHRLSAAAPQPRMLPASSATPAS